MALHADSLRPIYPKYEYQHTDRPKEACHTYLCDKNPFNLPVGSGSQEQKTARAASNCSNRNHARGIETVDIRGKSRGLFYHHTKDKVNVICGKLSDGCKSRAPVICRGRTRTRCTQTRYRESSAQTRSYLPELAKENKENSYKNFEVYQISKLLNNYLPPGEYEVKVVERARRRRQYETALKLLNKNSKQHQFVLEALEWEEWVAREEYIQGCQMLRMKVVETMFENREKNLRQMSEQRISLSTQRILAKQDSKLRQIQVEYDREMRRLDSNQKKISRNYHKENIVQEQINPASDLRAPQMRFGVNPNRRHYVGYRKNFDERIDELDRQRESYGKVSALALVCPFRKLRTWAKPKERMKEVTQRFCSDTNLRNMYESLKGLRIIAEAPKRAPRCLKKKVVKPKAKEPLEKKSQSVISFKNEVDALMVPTIDSSEEDMSNANQANVIISEESLKELPFKSLKDEDETANILGEFEGTAIGDLLQFLNDELQRLKLQKKFQAIHLLAQKDRWWREAAEAGQRQKENKARDVLEEEFAKVYETRQDTSSLFLESILEREFNFTASTLSSQKIAELAEKTINNYDDEERSDFAIQFLKGKDRKAYDRMIVGECIRNEVFAVAEERFAKLKADKLLAARVQAIEELVYASVERALYNEFKTPEAICIVGEILDDLIDNAVTYDFNIFTPSSSEEEFDTVREVNDIINKLLALGSRDECDFFDSTDITIEMTAEKEAAAMIRKLIRRAVPEERWQTQNFRIVEQTLSDTFNEAFNEIECLKASKHVHADDRLSEVISEIYNRLEDCGLKQKIRTPEESSLSIFSSSGSLKSIPPCDDIHKYKSFSVAPTYLSSGSTSSINSEVIQHYYYVRSAVWYEPSKVFHCHERYNLLENSNLTVLKSETSLGKVVSYNTTSSSGEEPDVTLISHYKNLIAKDNAHCFLKHIHPDFPDPIECHKFRLMTDESYVRASTCFDRVSVHQERPSGCSCAKPIDGNRRSSC